MKKLLFLISLGLLSAACDTEEDHADRGTALFKGTLRVESVDAPDAEPFTLEGVTFEIARDDDGTFNLTMHAIRFAASMPRPLEIVLPKLCTEAGSDGQSLVSMVDPIVPYIGGKPYTTFEIDAFRASCSNEGSELDVTFVCRNPEIPVDGSPLNHRAVYKGTLID